jgi:hypothetical protein
VSSEVRKQRWAPLPSFFPEHASRSTAEPVSTFWMPSRSRKRMSGTGGSWRRVRGQPGLRARRPLTCGNCFSSCSLHSFTVADCWKITSPRATTDGGASGSGSSDGEPSCTAHRPLGPASRCRGKRAHLKEDSEPALVDVQRRSTLNKNRRAVPQHVGSLFIRTSALAPCDPGRLLYCSTNELSRSLSSSP